MWRLCLLLLLTASLRPAAQGQSALEDMRRELLASPEDSSLWKRLAAAPREPALRAARAVLASRPQSVRGWRTLARLAQASGDYPLAVRALESAADQARRQKRWNDAYRALGALFNLHSRIGARHAAMQALRRYRRARLRAGKDTRTADALLRNTAREQALVHLDPVSRYQRLALEARHEGDAGAEREALGKLLLAIYERGELEAFLQGIPAGRRLLALHARLKLKPAQAADDGNGCARILFEAAIRLPKGKRRQALLEEALNLARDSLAVHLREEPDSRSVLRDHCLLAHIHQALGHEKEARPHFQAEYAIVRAQREQIAAGRRRDDPTERALRVFDGEVHHIFEDYALFHADGSMGTRTDLKEALQVSEDGRVGALRELYRIRGRRPPVWMASEAPLTAIQRSCRESRTAVIVYLVGSHRAGVVTLTGRDLSFASLGSTQAMDDVMRRFSRLALDPASSRAAIENAGRLACERLMTPALRAASDARRLIVIGLARWGYVPLAALVLPGKGPLTGRYLGARFEIIRAPTLGSLVRDPTQPAAGPPAGFACEGRGAYAPSLARFFRSEDLPPLTSAGEEAHALAVRLGGRVLAGHAASEANLRRLAGEASILHFSCHAQVDGRDPARTALLLSPNTPADDGFLTLSEILALRVRSRLVVLSACSSAAGEEFQGEGIRGLSRCFLVAGARWILGTLAPADDTTLPLFMRAFAEALATGATPARAALLARKHMLAEAFTAHPALWATFVLFAQGGRILP